ncbi:MAG: amidohydrolase family protein [Colwellia sp.]|nr:amidohydrolase family protein [Colwellia sp.]
MKIIDPHLHLFNLNKGDYHWLNDDKPPFWSDKHLINKAFTESDLVLDTLLELVGFIHIEAGFDNQQPWRELKWLEKHCQRPFRAIAAIDLTLNSKAFQQQLSMLIAHPSFVGIRHILDEQVFSLLTNKQVIDNIDTLNKFSFIFEVQMQFDNHIAVNALYKTITNNTNLTFIINHAGFPTTSVKSVEWQRWQHNLLKLSTFSHVAIKCSGWEITDRNYQTAWMSETLTEIFNIFDIHKIMLASNFPLCLFNNSSYQDYWLSLLNTNFFQTLNQQQKSALVYDNTLYWYQLKIVQPTT